MLESAYLMQQRTAALKQLPASRVVALNDVRNGQWYAHPIVAAQVAVRNIIQALKDDV